MPCFYPFFVEGQPVPCGKCPDCRIAHANKWAFRIMHQAYVSDSVMWLRFSYDDYHVPITPNRLKSLCKRDIQLFFKRYRKLHGKGHKPIKYYVCGEYGSRFGRPHYHLIILNGREDLLHQAWTSPDTGLPIGEIYRDQRPLTPQAIKYTVGYMNKRQCKFYKSDDRVLEFSLMSKGMGLSYLTDEIIEYHRADLTRNFVRSPDGLKVALPRYYADRIFPRLCSVVASQATYKELRAPLMDTAARAAAKRAFDKHIVTFGDASDFIRSQAEARRAAILNFQSQNGQRDDHLL